jgi:hypothetical protein
LPPTPAAFSPVAVSTMNSLPSRYQMPSPRAMRKPPCAQPCANGPATGVVPAKPGSAIDAGFASGSAMSTHSRLCVSPVEATLRSALALPVTLAICSLPPAS